MTRSELYKLIWSKPGGAVATELGVNSVQLSRLCKRYEVPNPPRGYWSKLRGRAALPAPPPLPPPSRSELETVEVPRAPEREPEGIRAAKDRATAALDRAPAGGQRGTKVQRPVGGSAGLVMQRTRLAMNEAMDDRHGRKHCLVPGALQVLVTPRLVDRAMRFGDRLFERLAAVDIEVRPAEAGVRIVIEEVPILVAVHEPLIRTGRDRAEGAIASQQSQPVAEHSRRGGDWLHVDVEPTGYLELRIVEDGVPRLRRTWRLSAWEDVDRTVDGFIKGLHAVAEVLKSERAEEYGLDPALLSARVAKEASDRLEAGRRRVLQSLVAVDRELAATSVVAERIRARLTASPELSRFSAWLYTRVDELAREFELERLAARLYDEGVLSDEPG